MKGVDTNILVYAHRSETLEHARAFSLLKELSEGSAPWAIAWSSLYEFIRVVTHPKVFSPVSSLSKAVGFIESLLNSPPIRVLAPSEEHWLTMKDLVLNSDARANLSFDAQIAAIFIEHGVKEIITNDSDFHRFAGLKVVNPFR